MFDLDQQIRAAIDKIAMHPTSTYRTMQLVDVLRAVLDIPRYDLTRPTGELVDDAQRRAWNRALDSMRMAIGTQFGLTQETTP